MWQGPSTNFAAEPIALGNAAAAAAKAAAGALWQPGGRAGPGTLSFDVPHHTPAGHRSAPLSRQGQRKKRAHTHTFVLSVEEEEEEEEEEDLFVFNDTIEGPRAPAVKPGRVTQA